MYKRIFFLLVVQRDYKEAKLLIVHSMIGECLVGVHQILVLHCLSCVCEVRSLDPIGYVLSVEVCERATASR